MSVGAGLAAVLRRGWVALARREDVAVVRGLAVSWAGCHVPTARADSMRRASNSAGAQTGWSEMWSRPSSGTPGTSSTGCDLITSARLPPSRSTRPSSPIHSFRTTL
jgi:hypothetical protein